MREVWVRIVCWKRHLVEDDEIEVVKRIMENDDQESYDNIVDSYDENEEQEYDDESLALKSDGYSHNVEIQNLDGTEKWKN